MQAGTAKTLDVRRISRHRRRGPFVVLALACALSVGVTSATRAQTLDRTTPAILDVALHIDGTLRGRTLTGPQNSVKANETIEVTYDGRAIAQTRSDAEGNFEIRGLRGGVHVVSTGSRRQVCRFWTDQAAPPGAVRGIAFVENAQSIVRGQDGGIWGYVVGNPGRVAFDGILLGTSATALAIAIDAKNSSD